MHERRFVPELVAPCGMNCGICMAYLRQRNKCTSCRGSDENKPVTRAKCKIKICDKLDSNFCYDCEAFPCDKLVHLDNRYRNKYGMSMIENLEYIQKEGIVQFLKKEEERWKCPVCGGVVCVHNRMCYACNKSVGALKSS